MTLTRRALLGGLASLLPWAPANGNQGQGGGEGQGGGRGGQPGGAIQDGDTLDFIPLILSDNSSFTARRILILYQDRLFGTGLDGRVLVRDEDKFAIGGLPLLGELPLIGGLFADRLERKDFSSSRRIGQAYGVGESLIIDLKLPSLPLEDRLREVATDAVVSDGASVLIGGLNMQSSVTANGKYSYHVPGTAYARLDPKGNLPILGDLPLLGKAFRMGGAYRHDKGHLLILITPTIILQEEE